jgi:hypothetical protein
MKLVSVPQGVLVDLIWNAELMAVGTYMDDIIEKQTAALKSHMPEGAFYPWGMPDRSQKATVIDISTRKTRDKP